MPSQDSPGPELDELALAKIIGVRAGAEHGYTGVWVVVVEGRAPGPQVGFDSDSLLDLDAQRRILDGILQQTGLELQQPTKNKELELRHRYAKDKEVELKQRPDSDGVRLAEEALRAVRDAKDDASRRRALEALDRALRTLRQQLPGARHDEKKS